MKNLRRILCIALAVLLAIPAAVISVSADGGDTVSYTFTDQASVSMLTGTSGASVTFDSDEGDLYVKATSSSPSVSFSAASIDDSYKYAVVTCRVPETDSSGAFEGKLILKNGSAAVSTSPISFVRGYKYYSSVVEISDAGSADSATLVFFNNCSVGDILYFYGVSFCKTEAAAQSTAETAALAANGPVLSKYTESGLKTDSYVWQEYTVPYWDAELVINEAVYPLKEQDGTMADVSLMYNADRIVSVRNSMLTVEYKEGVDYELVNGKLRI
ncbi:MAG: hypothetical protein IJT70_03560, partial [Clostridia bacterium]|nr:hypothetical protein [Clostridia bacterium]